MWRNASASISSSRSKFSGRTESAPVLPGRRGCCHGGCRAKASGGTGSGGLDNTTTTWWNGPSLGNALHLRRIPLKEGNLARSRAALEAFQCRNSSLRRELSLCKRDPRLRLTRAKVSGV